MQKNIRDKNWREFVFTFDKIAACDTKGEALMVLNGIRAGYMRSKDLNPIKLRRIATIEELIGYYK